MTTPEEFREYFDRGQFTYGDTAPAVRDKDIDSAIAEATAVFNTALYPDEVATIAFLYLTAHFLSLDIDASNSGGQPSFNQTSRSADGISESVQIPEWMMKGDFAFYSTTYYGQKWLMLTRPYLDGVVMVVEGSTRP